MASASDLPPPPPPASSCGADPTPVAPAAPDPEPSTKRRWSPSTWRYAIEDSQPELPSRQRLHPSVTASPATPRVGFEQAPATTSSKSRPNHHHGHYQDHVYGKDSEDPRRSSYVHRGTELTDLHSKHSRSHEMSNKRKRSSPPEEQQSRHFSSTSKRHSPVEEEEDNEVEEEDEGNGLDAEFGHEEGTWRRKRHMSPSEIYFCEICRAKTEVLKGRTTDSPNCSTGQ